jgi:3-hydroxyisobutyrate dehydrogenase-like beta-hydroxyacid dehydrogenase
MAKDLGLCEEAASGLGVPMPIADAVLEQWHRVIAELGADSDITTIARQVARAAGITLPPDTLPPNDGEGG